MEPAKSDMLADIFERQRLLQLEQIRAGKRPAGASGGMPVDKDDLRTQFLAAFVELAEAVQETNWKPWKFTGQTRRDKFLDEMVDLEHFKTNLLLIYGVTPEEFHAAFVKKNDVNLQRIRDGY